MWLVPIVLPSERKVISPEAMIGEIVAVKLTLVPKTLLLGVELPDKVVEV
jgi:hypothetical protein